MRRWLAVAGVVFSATAVQAGSIVVGFWNFDEGSGDVASDSSGQGYHGTVNGATWIQGGYGPHALKFSGGDIVEMGDRANLEPTTVTVAACLRSSTSQGGYTYIVSEGLEGCVCASYALFASGGNTAFYTCTGAVVSFSEVIPGADALDGRWHRVVGTYDGASVRIFLDGTAVGSPVAAVAPNYSMSNHSDFSVGRIGGGCGAVSGFVGDIDQVRVWDGVLTDVEIQEMGDCRYLMSDGFESVDTSGWAMAIP